MANSLDKRPFAALLGCLLLATSCDAEHVAPVQNDGFDDVDADFRSGNISQFVYHLLLGAFVRGKAHKQGFRPMKKAPHVRPALVELGQALAFDKELSGNRDISCMTCHHPFLATDDDLSLSIGVGGTGLGADRTHPEGVFIPRNAPPLFNLHAMDTMFWDGRVSFHGGDIELPRDSDEHITPEMMDTFEFGAVSAQAMFPVTSRREMRGRMGENELAMVRDDDFTGQWEGLMARLGEIPEYRDMFEDAYPGTDFEEMTFAHAANAIAGFEIATFEAADTPWDDFLRGDVFALSIDELQGARHFLGEAGCANCHSGRAMTDLAFHNTGLPQFGEGKHNGQLLNDDFGHENVSDDPADLYAFRTAPLRNIALTGPYGHAGQFIDLQEFVAHYLDPEQALLDYDVTQIDPLLQPTLVDNTDAVLANLSPGVDTNFAPERLDQVTMFLEALTDPASLDLADTVPATVPSGLPVEENVLVIPDNRAGVLEIPMALGPSGGREMQIQEPSMCNDDTTATVAFDENANTVVIDAHFVGLPYRPSICYDYNPSTAFNAYPDCVEDGKWQMWILTRNFTRLSTFWYDLADGSLIGNEFDVDEESLPPAAFPVVVPVGQMLCSDMFESDPETLVADVHFEFAYDQMLDGEGTGGVFFSVLPYNLFAPDELDIYYTQGGLPPSEAQNFRDLIEDNASDSGGLIIATSYEPDPKPAYLKSRDNIMIGFGGQWPADQIPLDKPVECGTTFQWDTGFSL